jgi:hypothetical protein
LTRNKITPLLSQVQFLPHFYNWQYDDMEMKKIKEIIPASQMDECEIDWAEYNGDYKLIYPGSWNWELIRTGEDHVDITKYADLQKLFSQKPVGTELNQIRTDFLIEMSGAVKKGVEVKIVEATP